MDLSTIGLRLPAPARLRTGSSRAFGASNAVPTDWLKTPGSQSHPGSAGHAHHEPEGARVDLWLAGLQS